MITLPINENELANVVRETIEALPRPPFVDHIEYEFRNSYSGDFAVYPSVIIHDGTEVVRSRGRKLERTLEGQAMADFDDKIVDSVLPRYGVFPYVRVLTVSEQAEVGGE